VSNTYGLAARGALLMTPYNHPCALRAGAVRGPLARPGFTSGCLDAVEHYNPSIPLSPFSHSPLPSYTHRPLFAWRVVRNDLLSENIFPTNDLRVILKIAASPHVISDEVARCGGVFPRHFWRQSYREVFAFRGLFQRTHTLQICLRVPRSGPRHPKGFCRGPRLVRGEPREVLGGGL